MKSKKGGQHMENTLDLTLLERMGEIFSQEREELKRQARLNKHLDTEGKTAPKSPSENVLRRQSLGQQSEYEKSTLALTEYSYQLCTDLKDLETHLRSLDWNRQNNVVNRVPSTSQCPRENHKPGYPGVDPVDATLTCLIASVAKFQNLVSSSIREQERYNERVATLLQDCNDLNH
jgi:hypothetical protein